jgi:ABC-type phosphate transport system substrate-binding protein
MRLAAVLLGLLVCGAVSARDEIAVIVATDAPALQIDATLLRDIYLKKIFLDKHGQSFVPVNLPPDHPLRRALADSIYNKNTQQLQNYWNQRYFHGIMPPYVLNSQEAVLQFVAKTPGAIGYIASCRIDARVKLVLSISVPPSQREGVERLCNNDDHASD